MTLHGNRALGAIGGIGLAIALACRFDVPSSFLMLLSVAAPLWALLALFCLGWASAHASAWTAKLAGAAGALCAVGLLLTDLATRSDDDDAPSAHALRIVEYNLSMHNRTPEAAAGWIIAQKPDVAVLLEATGQGAAIARALHLALPYRVTCHGQRRCSTVILSRIAPVESRGLSRGDAANRRTLSAALARFGAPWDMTVVAVHFSRPLPIGRQSREIAQLAAALRGRNDQRLVVTGDFNSPGWSMAYREVQRALALRPVQSAASWPATGWLPPFLAIDHALLRGDWASAHVRQGPASGSDHLPTLLTLTPANNA